jgi:hypothetical protein
MSTRAKCFSFVNMDSRVKAASAEEAGPDSLHILVELVETRFG